MMFHETSADNIHVFDISRGDHSATDSETPYGIFTKSRDNNIGIGDRQMKLYVKAENTLNVASREYVSKYIPDLVPYYDEIKRLDDKYGDLAEKAMDREMELLEAWSDAHPDADMEEILPLDYIIENKPAKIDDAEYLAAHKHYEDVMAEWTKASDVVRVKCKDIITDYLRDNGYDSMYLFVDAGSNGRQTDALIVLDENQVKSANTVTHDDNGNVIPLSERFNSGSNDIRYSSDEYESYVDKFENISDDDYLEEKEKDALIKISDHTSPLLNSYMGDGVKDRGVLIRKDALYLALRSDGIQVGNYHSLGKEVMKKLPELMNDPDVILRTDANKRVITISVIPNDGRQLLVSIEFDTNKEYGGRYGQYNLVITAFTIKKRYLVNLLAKNGAKILYEKEDLSKLNPQLHEWLGIAVEKSSTGNVSDSNGKVNTSQRNSTEDSDVREIHRSNGNNIRETFNALNNDAAVGKLAERVFDSFELLQEFKDDRKYPISFVSNERYEKLHTTPGSYGQFTGNAGYGNEYGILINADKLNELSDQEKASTILHEVIHACTVSYIGAANRYLSDARRLGIAYDYAVDVIPEDASDAVKAAASLIDVYSNIKADKRVMKLYGLTDEMEMVAELSNPEFRSYATRYATRIKKT